MHQNGLDKTNRATAPSQRTMGNSSLTPQGAPETSPTTVAQSYPSYLPGHGTLSFTDPLPRSGNDGRWADSSAQPPTGGQCLGQRDGFHVSTETSLMNCYGPNGNDTFGTFAFQVHMIVIRGDCGGLLFYPYAYEVCQQGSYALKEYSDSGSSPAVLSSTRNGAIRAGFNQDNLIAFVVKTRWYCCM